MLREPRTPVRYPARHPAATRDAVSEDRRRSLMPRLSTWPLCQMATSEWYPEPGQGEWTEFRNERECVRLQREDPAFQGDVLLCRSDPPGVACASPSCAELGPAAGGDPSSPQTGPLGP